MCGTENLLNISRKHVWKKYVCVKWYVTQLLQFSDVGVTLHDVGVKIILKVEWHITIEGLHDDKTNVAFIALNVITVIGIHFTIWFREHTKYVFSRFFTNLFTWDYQSLNRKTWSVPYHIIKKMSVLKFWQDLVVAVLWNFTERTYAKRGVSRRSDIYYGVMFVPFKIFNFFFLFQ